MSNHLASPVRDDQYFPDEDLRIMNLVSWCRINKPKWAGQIVGKKFFPTKQNPDYSGGIKGQDKITDIYSIRTGFFTSMRPGKGQLLLNVNPSTLAFFSPVNLQEWMVARWKTVTSAFLLPTRKQWHELKGLQVIFEGDQIKIEGDPNSQNKRVIRDFQSRTVSQQTFTKDDGKVVTIYDYMRDRKLLFQIAHFAGEMLTHCSARISKST